MRHLRVSLSCTSLLMVSLVAKASNAVQSSKTMQAMRRHLRMRTMALV